MSDYSKTTDFTAKDALLSGDPNKVIKGSEHDTEFDNISTAVGTKANKVASASNNNILTMDATGDLVDSTIVTDGAGTITATITGNVTGNLTGNVTGNADTATQWETTRTITMTGDITADTVNIDGTGNIDITNSAIAATSVDTAELADGAVQQAKLQTATVSLAGTLPNGSVTSITMNAYAFFPMVHCSTNIAMIGHTTDGASADSPRFMLQDPGTGGVTYDVDYRYIDA